MTFATDEDMTLTDGFCGAGGSTQGAHAVAGVRVVLAMNHWKLAIESHAVNFPATDHAIADISQADPRKFPRTRLAWFSPECTRHSQAQGKKLENQTPDMFGDTLPDEAAERSRSTMSDVVRFSRVHRYDAVFVENVIEVVKWHGYKIWMRAMLGLGYQVQIVCLNSMHAPSEVVPRAPQSRDRIYFVFTRAGAAKPDVTPRPLAWCPRCGIDVRAMQVWKRPEHPIGRYRAQYFYACDRSECGNSIVEPYALAAASAIDWALPGLRIGDRAKPLSAKTIARIEAGLRRYGRPMTFEARGNTFVRPASGYARAWPVDQPTATLTTTETRALVVPVESREGVVARSASEPMRTQTARHQDVLVVPYYGNGNARPATRPMPTMGTVDTAALVVPSGGTWNDTAYSAEDPFRTQTTREHEGVAFIAELRGGGSETRPVTEPLATVVASGNHHMLVRHNTARGNPAQMCTPASEPARTITTAGHQSLVSIEDQVDNATFRMLEPHEIQAAMAFGRDYTVLGNRRERVKQLGNAVTPPAAEFLIRAVVEALEGAA